MSSVEREDRICEGEVDDEGDAGGHDDRLPLQSAKVRSRITIAGSGKNTLKKLIKSAIVFDSSTGYSSRRADRQSTAGRADAAGLVKSGSSAGSFDWRNRKDGTD